MEGTFLAYALLLILAIAINYFVTRMAVKNGTKDALKQAEYYLEIIAKHFHDNKK